MNDCPRQNPAYRSASTSSKTIRWCVSGFLRQNCDIDCDTKETHQRLFHTQHPKAWQSLQRSFQTTFRRFFRASLGCDSASRARFISSRLPMFISFVKLSRLEPALLLDIVQKRRKLEQKYIDDYLLSIQTAFYAAAINPLKSA